MYWSKAICELLQAKSSGVATPLQSHQVNVDEFLEEEDDDDSDSEWHCGDRPQDGPLGIAWHAPPLVDSGRGSEQSCSHPSSLGGEKKWPREQGYSLVVHTVDQGRASRRSRQQPVWLAQKHCWCC